MRVLIIGGTGVISTPLTRYLVEAGHELTLYNRGTTAPDLPREVMARTKVLLGDRTRYAEFDP